ncbi:MAG: MT-A70 family methyltransferase, partial [Thermomicrobiales bacterium]
HGAARSAYTTLTDEDLMKLPIQDIAKKDSMLFLWTTGAKLDVAIDVMRAWGFDFLAHVFAWHKTYASGKPYHGIGFWTMHGLQNVLLGKRGKGLPRREDTRGHVKQVFSSPARRHSEKPSIHQNIELLVGGECKRIELFARQQVAGWDATGLECDGVDIRDFLTTEEKEEPE